MMDLFSRFMLVSLLAFGGGQAALPLIERTSVAEMAWVTPTAFAAAVGFGYLTPGPVLITATFIGYMAAGLPGAFAATLGVFLAPTLLAALTAAGVGRLTHNRWLGAFGKGAAPAVVGLLGATTWTLGVQAVASVPWIAGVIAVMVAVLAARTRLAPGWLLAGGTLLGWCAAR